MDRGSRRPASLLPPPIIGPHCRFFAARGLHACGSKSQLDYLISTHSPTADKLPSKTPTPAEPANEKNAHTCEHGARELQHKTLNAFSVDVEDYFQVSAFKNDIPREDWGRHPSRVVDNTQRILDLLHRHDVRATFFVLGWVAQRHPQLVRDIHDRGHEIGSHTYSHCLIYEQSPEEFREDLRRSRDVLEDLVGRRVVAHRAPSFSITKRSLWALEILAEEGFLVDSSVFPIYHDRYGIPNAEPSIHRIETPSGPLWEFPPSVVRMARMNLPVSGGGYFRLYPLPLTVHCLKKINRKADRPFVFYVHPWEIDPEQPRLKAGSRVSRFRHYVNLRRTEAKLDALLQEFRFGRMCEVVEQAKLRVAPRAVDVELPASYMETNT